MADKILAAGRGKQRIRLGLSHAACEAEGQALANQLRSQLKPDTFVFGEVGPAIGTYTGQGALGAFMWAES